MISPPHLRRKLFLNSCNLTLQACRISPHWLMMPTNGDYIFIMGSESVTAAAGNTEKVELSVMYENGKAYHYSKGENGNFIKGAEYKGDNSFIIGAVNVNDLKNSNKSLGIGETKRGAAGTAYFPGTNFIRCDRRSFNIDGLSTNSVISLGHEIAHA